MRASSVTASFAVFALAAVALPERSAFAADLYGEEVYEENSYYDDDRDAPPAQYGEGPAGYSSYKDDPPAGSIKDGYPVPMPPPRYSDNPPERVERIERIERVERVPRRSARYACLDRHQVRHRLRADGWADIHPIGGTGPGPVVRIKARRIESGRMFVLRLDRCSGEVLAAQPHYLRSFGGYRERHWHHHHPRRWARHRY